METEGTTLIEAMRKLYRYGSARDRATDHEPRIVTLTDDEALALHHALTLTSEQYGGIVVARARFHGGEWLPVTVVPDAD